MDFSYSSLEQDPFSADVDARYVYLNARQEELLVTLVSAIAGGRTRLLVTGGEGSGKSAFLRKLAEVLYTSCDVALLGHEMVFSCGRDTSLEAIEAVLLENTLLREGGSENTQAAVLLLDDADRMDPSVLAGLWRRLPELNGGWSSTSVVMSAMPQPKRLHGRSEHDAMAAEQTFELPPMALVDVEGLIKHRLQVAGLSSARLFTPDALERIGYFSKRVPGRIVQLCEYIFSKMDHDFSTPVSGDVVKDAAYDLFLPGHLQKLARGLASQPKPPQATGDSEPRRNPGVPGGRGMEGDNHAAHDDALAGPEPKGDDDITMPSPPSGLRATAVSAAAQSPQHRRQHGKPRMGARLLAVAGAALVLIVATVVAVDVRQGHQFAVSSFEAAVESSDHATGDVQREQPLDAGNDSAAERAAPLDRRQDSPARSASPAAPAPEIMPDEAGARAEETARARTAVADLAEAPDPAPPIDRSDEPTEATGAVGADETARLSPADQRGDQTLALVEPRRPPTLVELNDVALVQSQLNALGYAAGPVDGIMGPRTRSAIRRFQADTGVPLDGRMSDALIASLRRQSAKSNLQNQGRERPRRRIMPAIRGQLDSLKSPQEFREYCHKNQDTWVFDRGTGKFVFCAHVVQSR